MGRIEISRDTRAVLENKGIVILPPDPLVVILRVSAYEIRSWSEAAGASSSVPVDRDVLAVEKEYPPKSHYVDGMKDVILVNFGKCGQRREHHRWASERGLRPSTPRRCFTIGRFHPKLGEELGMGLMAVVSLNPCSFKGTQSICHVWWCDEKRGVGLKPLTFDWAGTGFLAFEEKWAKKA